MTELEKVIRGLRDIDMFIAGRLEHEKAKNFLRTIDETIALLKEQNGLTLALEQSNAVNGYLNAEVERLNGLLKEQEAVEPQLSMSGMWYECPICHRHITKDRDNYCARCGRSLKWE